VPYGQLEYEKYEKQLYWEDMEVGLEIASLSREATLRQCVKDLAARWFFHEIHFDEEWAHKEGVPHILVPATLHYAYLLTTLTDWIGPQGMIRKLGYQNRGFIFIGDVITTKGEVTSKYTSDGDHLLDLAIWNENNRGERPSPGSATVRLPSRTQAAK